MKGIIDAGAVRAPAIFARRPRVWSCGTRCSLDGKQKWLCGLAAPRHDRGRSWPNAPEWTRTTNLQRTMQLNCFGPVKLILRLLPGLRERRSGQIVNVSTIGVQTNAPKSGVRGK